MRDPNDGERQPQERGSQPQGNQEMNQGASNREGSHHPIGVAERFGTGRSWDRPEFLLSLE